MGGQVYAREAPRIFKHCNKKLKLVMWFHGPRNLGFRMALLFGLVCGSVTVRSLRNTFDANEISSLICGHGFFGGTKSGMKKCETNGWMCFLLHVGRLPKMCVKKPVILGHRLALVLRYSRDVPTTWNFFALTEIGLAYGS